MTKIAIQAGICGFYVESEGNCEDGRHVTLTIRSNCPDIQRLAIVLKNDAIDVFKEMECHTQGPVMEGHALVDTQIYRKASKEIHCSDCCVPAGLIKTALITAGLALPADVHIEIVTR